jgi:hypothetical protein
MGDLRKRMEAGKISFQEFEKAVEKGLEAKGMKKGDVKASWDTAADIAKRQGLA